MKFLALFFVAAATALVSADPHNCHHQYGRDVEGAHHAAAMLARSASGSPNQLARAVAIHERREARQKRCYRKHRTSSSTSSTSSTSTTSTASSTSIAAPVVNVAVEPAVVTPPAATTTTPAPAPAPTTTPATDPAPSTDGGSDDHFGDATFFNVGLGACGDVSNDSEFIVAVSRLIFDSFPGATANPNENPVCDKRIRATANGKTVDVVVKDRCPECTEGSLDLSPAAFNVLANPDVGRLRDLSWHFL